MKSAQREKNSVLEGKLEDVPLADIVQVLQVGAKSGALVLRRGDGQTAVLAFRGGSVIQAMSTESYKSLGDRLVASEAIKKADLQGALDYMTRFPGMRVGDALVELGTISRGRIEDEVAAQMAETIERLMTWTDAEFEFQVGFVALPRGLPALALDLLHEKGVEPRRLLLEASLLKDKRARHHPGTPGEEISAPPQKAGTKAEEPEAPDEEAEKILRWFNEGAPARPSELEDLSGARTAASYLSISEELFVATGKGEIGLLFLRYASELYSDGGLLMRTREGFQVLGQFGNAFSWGEASSPKAFFAAGESPLFDTIAAERRPYAGFVAMTGTGGLAPVSPRTPGARVALAIPLLVLGDVSLILFCRTAVASAPDARALIALARQVSITLENAALREAAKRTMSPAAVV
ncbi:MAG TPA: DUF4388 domain-containing protein [Thermoanaerobaculia bacterium]|nr:DUF4388 domain-containing protein [Thermoanaerobaculia bacterium]